MAHFYAEIKGSATTAATRRGTKSGGLEGHLRGWNIGVKIYLGHYNGKDVISVYETSGSNNPNSGRLLVQIKEN